MRRIPQLWTAMAAAAVVVLSGPAIAAEPAPGTAPPAPACDAARARAVALAVQRRYDSIRDLAADFTQVTESVVLATGGDPAASDPATSRGRVIFAKPGRMRWAYREPEKSFVISNGSVLWIYDVEAAQATRMPVADDYLAGAAIQFLLGEGDLLATFDVTALDCSGATVELDLRPRQPSSYERLGLTADESTGTIVETSIVDLFGNRTRIRFENLTVDASPPEGTFEFDPPSGVDVIDVEAGR